MKKLLFIFLLLLLGVAGSVTTASGQGPTSSNCVGAFLDKLGKDILNDSDGTLDGFLRDNGVNGVKAWDKVRKGGIDDFIDQPGYIPTLEKVAKYQAEAAAGSSGTVKYYRVQTNHPDSKFLTVDEAAGTLTFNKPNQTLFMSTTTRTHADDFARKRIDQGFEVEIIEFEVPKSFDIQMKEAAVPQYKAPQNLLNPDGTAPQIVDPHLDGDPFGLPSTWHQNLENAYIPGTAKFVDL